MDSIRGAITPMLQNGNDNPVRKPYTSLIIRDGFRGASRSPERPLFCNRTLYSAGGVLKYAGVLSAIVLIGGGVYYVANNRNEPFNSAGGKGIEPPDVIPENLALTRTLLAGNLTTGLEEEIIEEYTSYLLHADVKVNHWEWVRNDTGPAQKGTMRVVRNIKDALSGVQDHSGWTMLNTPGFRGDLWETLVRIAEGFGGVRGFTPEQIEVLIKDLVNLTGYTEEALKNMSGAFPDMPSMTQVLRNLINKLCIINPETGCIDFILAEQSQAGKEADSQRCMTDVVGSWAVTAPYGTLFRNASIPVILFSHAIENVEKIGEALDGEQSSYELMTEHVITHELFHFSGAFDPFYLDFEKEVYNSPPEETADRLKTLIEEVSNDLPGHLKTSAPEMLAGFIDFYLKSAEKNGLDINVKSITAAKDELQNRPPSAENCNFSTLSPETQEQLNTIMEDVNTNSPLRLDFFSNWNDFLVALTVMSARLGIEQSEIDQLIQSVIKPVDKPPEDMFGLPANKQIEYGETEQTSESSVLADTISNVLNFFSGLLATGDEEKDKRQLKQPQG